MTGASSGIGRHLATVAAQAGAIVALGARRIARIEEVAAAIVAGGGRAIPIALDVTDQASIESAFERIEAEVGPPDVLVNNAGIASPVPSLGAGFEENLGVWAVNVQGAFAMAQRAARRWTELGHPGTIVNVASILGLAGSPGVAAYCASKAALTNLTRALAAEWARYSIRVNALAPGYFKTELNSTALEGGLGAALLKRVPMRRFGEFEDLTGPFLLLASDASRFMTGSILVVDGGHTCWT